MKRHFLLRMFVINMFLYCVASGCPCGFSADNAQPFFEQYELKNNVIKPNEKEKAHEKNNTSHANTTDSTTRCK